MAGKASGYSERLEHCWRTGREDYKSVNEKMLGRQPGICWAPLLLCLGGGGYPKLPRLGEARGEVLKLQAHPAQLNPTPRLLPVCHAE